MKKTKNGYLIVGGKICIGDVKPKHEGGVVYKSNTGYGVIGKSDEREKRWLAGVIIKKVADDIGQYDITIEIDSEERKRVEQSVGTWIRDTMCLKIDCFEHDGSDIERILCYRSNFFNNDAIVELREEIKRMRDSAEIKRGGVVTDNVDRMPNLCNSIWGILDRLAASGCVGVDGYRINDNRVGVMCRYASPRYMDFVVNGKYAYLYPACKVYCAEMFKVFMYNNKVSVNLTGKDWYKEKKEYAINKDWEYCKKNENGYVMVHGKICSGVVKPKHKDRVVCIMPDAGYGVLKECVEIKKEDLANAVISESAGEIAVGDWGDFDAQNMNGRKRISVECIAKHVKEKSGCSTDTEIIKGFWWKEKRLNKLFSDEAMNEFVNAIEDVRNGRSIASSNNVRNLYNVVYRMMDKLVEKGVYSVRKFDKTRGEMVNRKVSPFGWFEHCRLYCESELYRVGHNEQVLKYWKCLDRTEDGYLVVHGEICIGDIKTEYKNDVVYKTRGGYGVVKERVKLKKEELINAVINRSAREMGFAYNVFDENASYRSAAVQFIAGSIIHVCNLCGSMGNDIWKAAFCANDLFDDGAIDELGRVIIRAKSGWNDVRVDEMPSLCNSIYRVMDRLVAVGCCGVERYRNGGATTEKFVKSNSDYMDLVEDREYARLYPACKEYCANVLKKFFHERAFCNFSECVAMVKSWMYLEKTENGYKRVYGEMYIGDIKPEHENNVVCIIPGTGYGVVNKSVEPTNFALSIVKWAVRKIKKSEWWKKDGKSKRMYIAESIRKGVEDVCGRVNAQTKWKVEELVDNRVVSEFDKAVTWEGSISNKEIQKLHDVVDSVVVKGCRASNATRICVRACGYRMYYKGE